MHSVLGIRHFVVKILIIISKGMCGIMCEVVGVHLIVVQEHATVEVLREEIESHVVDVGRHDLIHGVLLVAPVNRERQGQVTSLQKGHFALEILILARVIVLVSVSNTNSGGQGNCLIVLELSSSECLL